MRSKLSKLIIITLNSSFQMQSISFIEQGLRGKRTQTYPYMLSANQGKIQYQFWYDTVSDQTHDLLLMGLHNVLLSHHDGLLPVLVTYLQWNASHGRHGTTQCTTEPPLWFIDSASDLLAVECLPHEDLLPGLLIVGVVNADDVCHVLLPDLILAPTPAWGYIKHVNIK